MAEPAPADNWLTALVVEQPPPPPRTGIPIDPWGDGDGYIDSGAEWVKMAHSWDFELGHDGWTFVRQEPNGDQHWTRPGKTPREGTSATLHPDGPLMVWTTSLPWISSGAYSMFGYIACRDFGGDRSACARWGRQRLNAERGRLAVEPSAAPVEAPPPDLPVPVDWPTFWKTERDEQDWLVTDVWPRGRALAMWAEAKTGKSEFVLHMVISLALGRDPWTGEPVTPVTVDYFDWEMTEDDLWDRLTDMGHGPDSDLSRLRYYLLPALPPLDTAEGGARLHRILDRDRPGAVVLDTFGRSVEGEEDRADTVRAFYAHTGIRMKASGVGYLRTDHAGKDAAKGQRGSSAKNDDVDIIWRLARTANGARLTSRGSTRVSWVPDVLELNRVDDPVAYRRPLNIEQGMYAQGAAARAAELDLLDVDPTWGRKKVVEWLRDRGRPIGSTKVLADAIRFRKDRQARGTTR